MLPPELLEILPDISAEGRELWLSLDPNDPAALDIRGVPSRKMWDDSARAINFLKHADRDTEALLPVTEIDNLSRIGEAVAWYLQLGFELSDEMEVLNIYMLAHEDNLQDTEEHPQQPIIANLMQMDEPTRRKTCLAILHEWEQM